MDNFGKRGLFSIPHILWETIWEMKKPMHSPYNLRAYISAHTQASKLNLKPPKKHRTLSAKKNKEYSLASNGIAYYQLLISSDAENDMSKQCLNNSTTQITDEHLDNYPAIANETDDKSRNICMLNYLRLQRTLSRVLDFFHLTLYWTRC